MSVIKITDHLWQIAEAHAKKSPDGIGVASTKYESVTYKRNYLAQGIDHVESVRFIESPTFKVTEI